MPASECASIVGGEQKWRGSAPVLARPVIAVLARGQTEPCRALFPSATSLVTGQSPESCSWVPQPSHCVFCSDPCFLPSTLGLSSLPSTPRDRPWVAAWAPCPPWASVSRSLSEEVATRSWRQHIGSGRAIAGTSILCSCGEHTDPRGPAPGGQPTVCPQLQSRGCPCAPTKPTRRVGHEAGAWGPAQGHVAPEHQAAGAAGPQAGVR